MAELRGGIRWIGMPELQRAMNALPPSINAAMLAVAYKKAGKPVIEAEKILIAPHNKTKNLFNSIGAVRVKTPKEVATVRIGPLRGDGKKGYHGHLLEFGTEEHTVIVSNFKRVLSDGTKFFGKSVRIKARPQPFAQPAIRLMLPEVERIMREEIANSMIKTLNRQLKRI